MFYDELLVSDEARQNYENVRQDLSQFVDECVRYLVEVYQTCERTKAPQQDYHHAPVFLLVRHLMEMLDGVGVLISKGCSEPCRPLLRSGFEAYLGILYILEKDSFQRGLSYLVWHAHKRIKLFRKLDSTEQSGKEFRKELQSDPLCKHIPIPALDYKTMIARLEGMLQQMDYRAVEMEWQDTKKRLNGDPEWYALFGGPRNIRELAKRLGHIGWYELLYRGWSDVTHAGSGLLNVKVDEEGDRVLRPLRHPDGLQFAALLSSHFVRETAGKMIERYLPERAMEFKEKFRSKLGERARRCAGPPIIKERASSPQQPPRDVRPQ